MAIFYRGRYLGLWYGGSNYAAPDGHNTRDHEFYSSIRAAGEVLQARADQHPRFPCVDDDTCEMHLYRGGQYHEDGPDVVLTLGTRGGVRRSNG